jgi:hypothetical protein
MRDANGIMMNGQVTGAVEDTPLVISIENALQASKSMQYSEFVAMA